MTDIRDMTLEDTIVMEDTIMEEVQTRLDMVAEMEEEEETVDTNTATNSTYKKLAVQWLIEHLCFISSSLVADSFVLRNRQLLVAAKR